MILTPIYKFKKRELTDSPPDITANNSNWDVLETNLKSHADSIASQGKQIDVLNERVITGVERHKTQISKNIHDLNSVTKTDLYFYLDNSDDTRKNAPDAWGGVLFHKQIDDGYCFQTAESLSGKIYNRMQLNGTWQTWEDKIGTLSNDRGYLNRKQIQNTDLNNLLTEGKYTGFNFTNSPTGTNIGFDIDISVFANANFVQQQAIQATEDKRFTRITTDGGATWTTWKDKISDLQGKLAMPTLSVNPNYDANSYIGTTKKVFIISGINTPKPHGYLDNVFFDGALFAPEGSTKGRAEVTYQTFTSFESSAVEKSYTRKITKYTGTGEISYSEWRQIATTDKVEILCTPNTGWEITYQYNYQINNVVYYSLRVKKSDNSDIPVNTSVEPILFPSDKLVVDTTFATIGATWTGFDKRAMSVCSSSVSPKRIYAIVFDAGTKQIHFTGTAVL